MTHEGVISQYKTKQNSVISQSNGKEANHDPNFEIQNAIMLK